MPFPHAQIWFDEPRHTKFKKKDMVGKTLLADVHISGYLNTLIFWAAEYGYNRNMQLGVGIEPNLS